MLTVAQPSIKDIVTEDVVFDALIESSGNPARAAELVCQRLELPFTLVNEIRRSLPRMIAGRLPELKRHMEAVAALELFSMLPILNKTLTENLTQLDPGEAVNAYMKLMDLIHKTTDDHELHIDHRWSQVPRELQEIYTQLEAEGNLELVLAGEVA